MKNRFLPSIILIFAFLFSGACQKTRETPPVARDPFPVKATVAQSVEIRDEITSSALLQGIRKATVVSQTSGEITQVSVKLGATVRAGNILVMTENSVQAANLTQAKGAVEESELVFASSERLFNAGSISKAEFVRSRNNLFSARTALASAQKAYNDTRITAPINGVVTMRNDALQTGNSIAVGVPLFTVTDISGLKVDISLGEREVGLIKTGALARVRVPALNVELLGSVSAVSSGSDRQTGTFLAQVLFNNPGMAVKDGMSGVATIEASEAKFGIAVPSNAVVNNRSVFIVRDGRAYSVSVEHALISQGRAFVTGGLSDGDTVIISGTTQLADGDTVSVSF